MSDSKIEGGERGGEPGPARSLPPRQRLPDLSCRAEEAGRGPAADSRERESEQDQVDRMRGSGREGERVGIDRVDPNAGTGIGRERRVDDQGAAVGQKLPMKGDVLLF